jgi:hypothetical protein
MSTITTRTAKGAALTWAEIDNNFTNLNTDKYQEGSAIGAVTPAAGTFTTLSSNGATVFTNGTSVFSLTDGGGSNIYTSTLIGGTSTLGRVRWYSPTQLRFSVNNNAIQFHTGASSSANGDGNAQMVVAHTASAVNYVQVTGSVTGSGVVISSQGSDTSPPMLYSAKGFSSHRFYTNGGTTDEQFRIYNTTTARNYIQVTGATAGNSPKLETAGSDTNIDLTLTPKGTGNVRFGTYTANMALTVQGYIEIKDSGGTVRKLAVIA